MSTVAPTPRRRRTAATIVTPGEDNTKTKVVVPEGTTVDVIEQQGGKTMSYQAQLKEVEEDEANEFNTSFEESHNGFEDQSRFAQEPPTPTIPKSPLDRLFEDIVHAVKIDGAYDGFIAKLLRKPDNMNDRFNVPCRDMIDIGAFSFNSTDRFNFQKGVQETNENSGGRFVITVFNGASYEPLTSTNNRLGIERPVAADLVIPNPKTMPQDTPGQQGGQSGGVGAAIMEMARVMQQNQAQLMQVLTRPAEKDEMTTMLMAAMMQKITNDILHPPQPAKANGIEDTMTNVMQSIAVTQAMAEGFAKIINRDPPAEREPDFIDKFNKIADTPIVKELGGRVMDIVEAASVKGLQLDQASQPGEATAVNPAQPGQPQQAPPQQAPPTNLMTEEQAELLTTIVEELESNNVLDAENETIKELAQDFPDEYSDLVTMCQAGPFEGVFRMLLAQLAKIQPFPLSAFLDVPATQAEMNAGNRFPYVWNEAGEKMIARLRELHAYLSTVTA